MRGYNAKGCRDVKIMLSASYISSSILSACQHVQVVDPQIPGADIDLILTDAARSDNPESDRLQTALVAASLLLHIDSDLRLLFEALAVSSSLRCACDIILKHPYKPCEPCEPCEGDLDLLLMTVSS